MTSFAAIRLFVEVVLIQLLQLTFLILSKSHWLDLEDGLFGRFTCHFTDSAELELARK